MDMPQLQLLSKVDLADHTASEIIRWGKDSSLFEEALSKLKSGEEYTLYTQLFRGLKKGPLSTNLFPISSYTREGFVALLGELSRIFNAGEELEE